MSIYSYTNSRNVQYFLNIKEVKLGRGDSGRTTNIYFFSKDERSDTGCELPEGRIVAENTNSGLPVLKKVA